MPESWFLFTQLEIPWELGPEDGRYLLRDRDQEPQHVVVLRTLGSGPRRAGGLLIGRARRGREIAPEPGAAAVAVTRATVVDPIPLSAEAQAQAWLGELDVEEEMWRAAGVLNRVLLAHRIAAADPYVNEVSPTQALVVRAGWGIGEQVAEGQWEHARELLSGQPRRQRRSAALRPQERLTWLLASREAALLCEELVLRARRDLDQGNLRQATVQLRVAYAAALAELGAERERQDMALRIAELRELSATIAARESRDAPAGDLAGAPAGTLADVLRQEPRAPDTQAIRHALERLEAALRARTVGLKLSG